MLHVIVFQWTLHLYVERQQSEREVLSNINNTHTVLSKDTEISRHSCKIPDKILSVIFIQTDLIFIAHFVRFFYHFRIRSTFFYQKLYLKKGIFMLASCAEIRCPSIQTVQAFLLCEYFIFIQIVLICLSENTGELV